MAEKDVQWGMITVVFAVIFLLSGLRMLEFQLFSEQFSMLIAFILIGVGVYLITKK